MTNIKNRTIFEADNLDILRGINSESIDLIYLDPPFKSDRTYSAPIGSEAAGAAFKDTWSLSDVDNVWHVEIADREPALYATITTAELTHGKSMKAYLITIGVRLMEIRRVLKDSGSVYLHCDPTASHYLKMAMDAVFGKANFKNDIIWRRYGSHNDAKRYGSIHDTILFYSVGRGYLWNPVYEAYDKEYLASAYRNHDSHGRYTTSPLNARTLSGGGYEYEWRGITDIWKFPKERLEQLDSDGLIHWSNKGKPRRKVYLQDMKGVPAGDIILDAKPLSTSSKERTGYPTQKPLALLERIIKASSNPGDMVLDPFCGCATTCIVAEKLNRQWVGIDLSGKAVELVKLRLERDLQIYESGGILGNVIHSTDVPLRTDLGE